MNKCIFGAARLTQDPEIRYTQGENQMAVANFSLAINRDYKVPEGQPTADFIRCTAFGHNADFAQKYLKKGTKVNVETHVQTGSYTNKDGQRVYTTDFIVDRFEFCESKSSGENTTPTQATATPGADFMTVPDSITEELPFN